METEKHGTAKKHGIQRTRVFPSLFRVFSGWEASDEAEEKIHQIEGGVAGYGSAQTAGFMIHHRQGVAQKNKRRHSWRIEVQNRENPRPRKRGETRAHTANVPQKDSEKAEAEDGFLQNRRKNHQIQRNQQFS